MPPKTKKNGTTKAALLEAAAVKGPPQADFPTSSEGKVVGNDASAPSSVSTTEKNKVNEEEAAAAAPAAQSNNDHDKDTDENSEDGSLDVGACCLCHSSMDYSDRAAFFRPDRMEDYNEDTDNEDEYYFRPNDPYLPVQLYDANNALLYCDGCDRMYHQKCHFCPVPVVPRGDWFCLLCTYFKDKTSPSKRKSKSPKKQSSDNKDVVSKKGHHSTDPKLYRQMREAFVQKQLFVSPPDATVRHLEQSWEYESRHLKATQFQSQMVKRVRQYVESQGSNYRLAETAIVTLTSSSKNRMHFLKQSSSSQELAQTLVKLYGIRKNWRQICWVLHDLQRSTNERWEIMLQYCETVSPDFVKRVLFPFGHKYPRRVEPRTAEAKQAWEKNKDGDEDEPAGPPTEITTTAKPSGKKKATTAVANTAKRSSKKSVPAATDDDSGISLDDLQCCVCHASEATDENDLVLCDGQGCFRAYHAHCVSPALKESDLEEDIDWFCPYCSALAETLLAIQTIHMGDEWEQERYAAVLDNKKDMDSSLQSWGEVDEVFPTAEQDHAAACQMKEGKRNKATDDLLARVLGLDVLPDHDDDDEVEDGNFDLDSYQKQREEFRKKKENQSEEESEAGDNEEADDDDNDSDESTHSSQATLVEMSSVELEVGKAELDALSKCSSDEEEDEGDAVGAARRRSRRLRHSIEGAKTQNLIDDIGGFDESNILEKKRDRKPVDYIQLNEAIFGDVPDEDAEVLDDTEEFEQKFRKKQMSGSEDGNRSSDSEDGSDDEADDEDGEEDSEEATAEKTNSTKASRSSGGEQNDDNGKKVRNKKRKTEKESQEKAKKKPRRSKGKPSNEGQVKKPSPKKSSKKETPMKNGNSIETSPNGDKKSKSLKKAATAKKTNGKRQ